MLFVPIVHPKIFLCILTKIFVYPCLTWPLPILLFPLTPSPALSPSLFFPRLSLVGFSLPPVSSAPCPAQGEVFQAVLMNFLLIVLTICPSAQCELLWCAFWRHCHFCLVLARVLAKVCVSVGECLWFFVSFCVSVDGYLYEHWWPLVSVGEYLCEVWVQVSICVSRDCWHLCKSVSMCVLMSVCVSVGKHLKVWTYVWATVTHWTVGRVSTSMDAPFLLFLFLF